MGPAAAFRSSSSGIPAFFPSESPVFLLFTCSFHPLSSTLPSSRFTPQSNPGCFHADIPQHPVFPSCFFCAASFIVQLSCTSAPIWQTDPQFCILNCNVLNSMPTFNMSNIHVFTAPTVQNRMKGPLLWSSRRTVQHNTGVCVCVHVLNEKPSYRTNNWKQIMLQVEELLVISSNGPSAAPK